ncbi:AAA family ATPase [Kribbella sp. NPDC023972]|uniref:AAA family ATPase n=1 Tax=Kribbella sp. NPDC023972 TaxID=3154795 RepID=UPI0033D8D183
MADIRSAAGEGSERSEEPRVPNRDQPAHELANLVAQSDAKGKGFWRRRRRKSAGTPDPSSPPADISTPAPTTADPTPADPKPAAPEPTEQEPTPTAEAEPTPAAEVEPTHTADAEVKADAEQPADTSSADVEEPADTTAAGVQERVDAPVADAEGSADAPAADAKEPADTPADDDQPAGAEVPAVEEPAAAMAEPPADDTGATEPARPTVGVVYEPDESPDGFPLEYGNIIVGLPKNPGTSTDDPESADRQADESADQSEADAAGERSDTHTEAVSDAPESADAADKQPDAASEQSKDASEQSEDVADSAEPQSADGQPVAPEADASPGHPEASAERVEGADRAGESADEPEAADAVAEQPQPASEQPEGTAESADPQPADNEPGRAVAESAEPEATENQPVDAEAEAEKPQATHDRPGDADAEAAAAQAGKSGDEPEVADVVGEQPQAASETAEAASETAESAGRSENPQAAESSRTSKGPQGSESAGTSENAEDSESAGTSEAPDADSAGTSEAPDADSAGTSREPEAADESGRADDEQSADAAVEGSAEQAAVADGPELGEQAQAGSGQAEGGAESGEARASEDPAADAAGEEELTAEQLAERAAAEQAAMALITALMRLRGALAASQLPIDVVGADEARQQQKAMLDQLDDYILPRLVQLEAPVLAVVGGSTGAGKSTLVNTIIGKVVSEPGVLRPTTRSPVLIHHPADADWFVGDRVLPGMARSSGDRPGGTEDPGQLRLVAADTVPQGLAILDAPDIDSVVEANRDLATQLLAAADLWLFVTTAARYADAVPWDFLQSASDRSTAVAVVLDRAPEDTIDDITGHLAQMLLERGLGDSPLFSIKETVVDSNGMLPAGTVASIKDWLVDLAADAEARAAVVRRTLHGAVTAMVKKTPAFAAAVKAQAETVIELRSTAETAYDRAVKDIAKATQDGTLLRGEVLARWQEFVGTGELLKGLQTNVGRLRDKMRNAVVGKPPPTRDLNDAVESGLESLLREHAEAAAERAEESWQSTAAGRQLLAAGDRDLGRMSKDFPAAASRAVRDWQGFVLDLVRKEGADKRSTARILAYGVNGLGLSLMVVIFASTAGITGAEVGVGAGTAVVGQKLLEAVFGDQAVRSLVTKAREDLDGRVHALMDAEFARYLAVLDQHPVDPEAATQLTEAARAVEDCT